MGLARRLGARAVYYYPPDKNTGRWSDFIAASRWLASVGERLGGVHLKDMFGHAAEALPDRTRINPGNYIHWQRRFCDLGHGEQPVKDAVAALLRLGYSGPWTVEIENRRLSDPLEHAEVNMKALSGWLPAPEEK